MEKLLILLSYGKLNNVTFVTNVWLAIFIKYNIVLFNHVRYTYLYQNL